MEEENLCSFCIKCFLLISLAVCVSNAHEFQCPSSVQWQFRAQSQCLITGGYICLLDENTKTFTENCKNRTYSDRAGYKLVIAGNLDQRTCESTRYQPFRFSTNGMSTCVFEKTNCNEEGLIVFNNGSTRAERQCRCDYSRGYDFISKPKHGCYCIPSMDDCSCYQKPCPQGFILSPDYQCIDLATWDVQFACELIVPYQSPNTNFPIDDTDTDQGKMGLAANLKIEILILISVTLTVLLIMALLTKFCLPTIEQNTVLKSLLTARVIPLHIRDAQTHLKDLWKGRFSHFVETRAFHLIKRSLEKEQCIIVSGPMGCGKSSTAFHIAMAFDKTEDCDVVIISYLDDLFKYASEDKKQLFLIDDVFGKYSASDYNSMWWNHHGKFLQNILNKNKDLKLILTSRLHIFLTVKPTQPTFCHLDFTSEDLMLTLEERKMIGRCYLRDHIKDDIIDDIIDETGEEALTSFFPILCANVRAENKEHIIEYFKLPIEYISSETNNMRKSGDAVFYALTILLIFDNKVKKKFFNVGSHQYDEMMQFLSKEIGFDTRPLKSLLFSRFIALKKSYVLENTEYFECIYINLFNALVLSIGPCIVQTLIVYGESSFLNKRTCPETSGEDYPKLKIIIPKELQDMYFERVLSDIILGKYDLFKGDQHSSVEFRKSCMIYFEKYLKEGDLKQKNHKTTVLHVVSTEGFVDYVEFFLSFDKSLINLQDDYGQTALHKACLEGHTNVAEILLDNDAFIDMADNNMQTALYIACDKSQIETVKYLLSRGPIIKHKKGNSKIPLHIVCSNGNLEIAKLLLDNKAKVNDQDANLSTPLHLACKNKYEEIVKLLVQYKFDTNLVDKENKTAIYIAAEQKDTDIVRCLLNFSPILGIATDRGRVALHCASENGSEEIAELLIEHNAAIDIDDTAGCTPLFIACENGHLNIVKQLLHNNALVNFRNITRNTPLLIACEKGYTQIVKLLLENKSDPNCKNSDQMTPLHKACDNDQTDIATLLINKGAIVNESDETWQTPLFRACLKGNYNVADELLKKGAFVNQENKSGLTPLHAACLKKSEDIVRLLLNSDADIQKEDKKGVTPLGIACSSGNKCIEDALLSKQREKQKLHGVPK